MQNRDVVYIRMYDVKSDAFKQDTKCSGIFKNHLHSPLHV